MKSNDLKKSDVVVQNLQPDVDLPENRSVRKIMEEIYKNKDWGGKEQDFYSGQGSHLAKIVDPYVRKILQFLKTFDPKLTVCDLGCGDFNVGQSLVGASAHYIGIDIVAELIARNKERFTHPNVSFSCLDIVVDDLPKADCALVRQVLQHLSNEQIFTILNKLKKFKYVIVTEHLPKGEFTPNLDIAMGADIRISKHSGVVLTAPPFNYSSFKRREMIQVHLKMGQIVTTLYRNY